MENKLSFLASTESARQSVHPVRPLDSSLVPVRSPSFLEQDEQKGHRKKSQKVSRSRVQVHAGAVPSQIGRGHSESVGANPRVRSDQRWSENPRVLGASDRSRRSVGGGRAARGRGVHPQSTPGPHGHLRELQIKEGRQLEGLQRDLGGRHEGWRCCQVPSVRQSWLPSLRRRPNLAVELRQSEEEASTEIRAGGRGGGGRRRPSKKAQELVQEAFHVRGLRADRL